MRGQALRYLGWQVWDRAGQRLVACLVIAAAVCLPLHFAAKQNPMPPETLPQTLLALHRQFTFVFALLFASGLIAQDRTQGWFRFYLAKPVSPVWFYGQAIMLAWLATVAASAGFTAAFSLAIAPVWSWRVIAEGLVVFALLGMPVVFFSSLVKHDWVLALLAVATVSILRARFPHGHGWLGDVLHVTLPPTHLMGARGLTAGQGWWWIAAWAAGLMALTLLVLRRRPLGED